QNMLPSDLSQLSFEFSSESGGCGGKAPSTSTEHLELSSESGYGDKVPTTSTELSGSGCGFESPLVDVGSCFAGSGLDS
ncbi:hypothetical protein BG015_007818, partial [Linnemannia schmuckeri]